MTWQASKGRHNTGAWPYLKAYLLAQQTPRSLGVRASVLLRLYEDGGATDAVYISPPLFQCHHRCTQSMKNPCNEDVVVFPCLMLCYVRDWYENPCSFLLHQARYNINCTEFPGGKQ